MPAKTPRKSDRVSFHDLRVTRPYLTWGSIGAAVVAVVGVLGVLGPWMVTAIKNIETTDSVEAKFQLAKAYTDNAIKGVFDQMGQNLKNGAIRAKWQEVANAETAMAVAHFPVEACDNRIVDTKNPMSVIERQACAAYRVKYGQASAKYERALADAQTLSERR